MANQTNRIKMKRWWNPWTWQRATLPQSSVILGQIRWWNKGTDCSACYTSGRGWRITSNIQWAKATTKSREWQGTYSRKEGNKKLKKTRRQIMWRKRNRETSLKELSRRITNQQPHRTWLKNQQSNVNPPGSKEKTTDRPAQATASEKGKRQKRDNRNVS